MWLLKQGHLQPNAFVQRDKIKLSRDGKFCVVQNLGFDDFLHTSLVLSSMYLLFLTYL